ncbi:MAG: proton-conducting transporter membrane subunit, partial [Gammaproteobacteria bacterium]|nr:proton-conducting transporter membrane subunit [Gammaproteobacteria bacterium]
ISHTGILIIGLFSLNHEAFQGGIMLAVNFGLAITGLLFTTGFIYWRTRTMLLTKLGGLFDHFPLIASAFFLSGLAIIGMPGTPGFDSVHLVLEASFERFGALVTVAAAIGNVIAAGFLLWAFQKAFLAPKTGDISPAKPLDPVTNQERLLAIMVVSILLIVGFYPEPWLALIENSLSGLSHLYGNMETN